MKDLSEDLFVTWEHVCKLTGKGISTARNELCSIRKQYGIIKPERVTRDHLCAFYNITENQYITRLKAGLKILISFFCHFALYL